MSKSLWNGAISFGLVHIPVHLSSLDNSHELALSMLDKRDFAPIGYKRINKETGKEVEWNNIVKGYEYEPGQYVVLTDEDLKRANVKATQTIDIQSFVEAQQIPLIFYEQPYYITPAKGGEKVYLLLYEALRQSNKIAIAQVVIRTKQHLVAIAPLNGVLILDTLRYMDEIRALEGWDAPSIKQAGITAKEIQMALALIEGMTEDWNPAQYKHTYHEDVLALVKKKIKAHQTKTISAPEKEAPPQKSAQIIDLMALLKESINNKNVKGVVKHKTVTTAKASR